jgi:hypothetical protein
MPRITGSAVVAPAATISRERIAYWIVLYDYAEHEI